MRNNIGVINFFSREELVNEVTDFLEDAIGNNILITEEFVDNSKQKRYLNNFINYGVEIQEKTVELEIWEQNRYIAYIININNKSLKNIEIADNKMIIMRDYCKTTIEIW